MPAGKIVSLTNWPTHVAAVYTSKKKYHTPWYVVPADDKKNARLIVSQIVLDAFSELKMVYPATTAERRRELKTIQEQL